jgi:5-methylcytosine-specific restriction endonuclease McrA
MRQLVLQGPSTKRPSEASEERQLLEYAISRAVVVLQEDTEQRDLTHMRVKLRLALHLAPASAIKYDRSCPSPRHHLIRDYLKSDFGLFSEEADRLSRAVVAVLNAYDERRSQVGSQRDDLLARQAGFCAHCRYRFSTIPVVDPYKPYLESPEQLTRPEVDHKVAVSILGTNDPDNLQVLCRLCNSGKGDGLEIDIRSEADFSGFPVQEIPRAHRIRMFFAVTSRDGRRCKKCDGSDAELTVRPCREAGGYLRSNLRSICRNCLRS